MFLFSKIISKNSRPPQKHSKYDVEAGPNTSEWATDFVAQNPWLCVVDDTYINDNFNLYGLSASVNDYQNALRIIRGHYYDLPNSRSHSELQKSAQILYGLIHARYLLTYNGVKEMQKKFDKAIFGFCPRVSCKNQPLLPIGLSPNPGEQKVKTYCPACQDVYDCDCDADGSYFGPYFPHFFIQAIKDEVALQKPEPTKLSLFGVPIGPDSPMNRCHYVHPVE